MNLKVWYIGLVAVVVLASCRNNNRLTPEQMQYKLDSIAKIENIERLEAQGIRFDKDVSPIQLFYDSLNLQTLPISYTEDYVRFLPAFKPIPSEILHYMDLQGYNEPKAVCLPESMSARLILVATDESPHLYSVWLYSLNDDYMPVDKLCLYAIEDKSDEIDPEEFIQFFSITSDYEIRLLDYSKKKYKTNYEEIYYVDSSRKFQMRETESE